MFAWHPWGTGHSLGLGDESESCPGGEDGTLVPTTEGVQMGETKGCREWGAPVRKGSLTERKRWVSVKELRARTVHGPELLGKVMVVLSGQCAGGDHRTGAQGEEPSVHPAFGRLGETNCPCERAGKEGCLGWAGILCSSGTVVI